jgi:protein-S-isoprenylcysteine O-methyltransferase Ste14
MLTLFRHLLAIVVLPFMAVVAIPYWLLSTFGSLWEGASLGWGLRLSGTVLLGTGFGLFAWCVALFARVGRGTLAPWDPPQQFVAVGPYRYVRNPMISGVAAMLLGEALLWASWPIGVWACLFFAVNHTYFILLEEPGLERPFGESYRAYKANVPRWIPRLRPGKCQY